MTTCRGLPVTTPARTLVDLGAVSSEEHVERALDDALRRGLVSIPYLAKVLTRTGGKGRRGAGVLRKLLAQEDRVESVPDSFAERRFIRLLHAARLPCPRRQTPSALTSGATIRVDFAYERERVAIEILGFRWHSSRSVWTRDQERITELTMRGWTVLLFTWRDLEDRPDWVLNVVRRALGGAGQLSFRR